jgi:hypothetical protein
MLLKLFFNNKIFRKNSIGVDGAKELGQGLKALVKLNSLTLDLALNLE